MQNIIKQMILLKNKNKIDNRFITEDKPKEEIIEKDVIELNIDIIKKAIKDKKINNKIIFECFENINKDIQHNNNQNIL